MKRIYILGDEWVYFKIYTGFKIADKILMQIIEPIVKNFKKNKIISNWFFIRYNDPDFHLRVRLKLNDVNDLKDVIFEINKRITPLIKKNIITKFQFDTYEREIERYGIYSIELSESVFDFDSSLILKTLSILHKENKYEEKWLLSLKLIDSLLNDFDYNLVEKKYLINILCEGYYNEFDLNKEQKKQIANKYRKYKVEINNIINNEIDIRINKLINVRTKQNSSIFKLILTLKNEGKLTVSINDLMISYIHMSMNRFFNIQQRYYELIIYDFLNRYYSSEILRQK